MIEKSPKKPIYERVDDILRDKQKHQAVVKAEMEEIKRKKEEVEAIITADTIHKRKMTREELEKKGN